VEYADGVLDLFPPNRYLKTEDGTETVDVHATDQKVVPPTSRSSAGLQIGLWLNGTDGCFDTYTGKLDHQIQLLIAYLERCRASKTFIRLGYEFDNPSFKYSEDPSMYILAFRKVVSDCREFLSDEANKRVFFVWHSWGAPFASKKLSLERFYPGDKFVDWIGVSIFQQVYPWSPDWGGKMTDVENVLNFAKLHNKVSDIGLSSTFFQLYFTRSSYLI
jgi:hypothetical protein